MKLSIFFYFCLLIICNSSRANKPIEPLLEQLTRHINENHIPGMMISIVNAEGVIYEGGLGYANLKKNEKVGPNHLFRLGSISKSITAIGLLKITKQKDIPLNTAISYIDKSIPYQNPWESQAPITIENLLEHTSGFDDMHLNVIYNHKDESEPTTAEMIKFHEKSYISRWKPGTFMSYSNSGYVLAGHILETLAAMPYSKYLKNEILKPLEMYQSGFYFKEPKKLIVAKGYQYDSRKFTTLNYPSIQGGPAGGFNSNARDMSYFLRFMLNHETDEGNTLDLDNIDFNRIENPQSTLAAKHGLRSGYALGNYSIWENAYLFHGHNGEIDGFTSRYLYSREADIGLAVSINSQGDVSKITDLILDYYLGDEKKTMPVTIKISDELKQTYSGFYQFKNPRNSLFAFSDRMIAGVLLDFQNDHIIVRNLFGNKRYVLNYAGNMQFYRDNDGATSALFLKNDNGEAALWVSGNYAEKESRAYRIIINISVWLSTILVIFFTIYGLLWFFWRFLSSSNTNVTNHLILWIGCTCFCLMFISFASAMDLSITRQRSFYTIMLFLSSITMLVFALLSIYRWFKLTSGKKFKVYYVTTSIALLVVSAFLYDAGFIGLKLWSY